MSSTELFALLDRAQSGDDEACRQVLTENAGLIWSIVRRYSGCGVETDDLYQLGCIGFIKAVKGFDLHYGTQFSTYAVPKIAGEIRRFLRDDGAVKVGRTIRERGQTLWSVRERLRGRLGREPEALGALGGDGVDAGGDREHRPRDCRAGVAAAGDGGGADARVHPRHREPGGRADRKNRAPGGD